MTPDQRHRRYNASAKGRERSWRYDRTAKGIRRKIDYDIRRGRDPRIQKDALAEREEYEGGGSALSFLDWLNETYPLGKLRIP